MPDRSSSIAYGRLMHQAMRGLIQRVLEDIARDGLPGDHHFFITFETGAPGVEIADWLRDRYPEEMTIVIQHWYDGLAVDDDGFSIVLNFGDNPEPLRIPFDAIRTFVDPSVEFGLRFESTEAPSETRQRLEASRYHLDDGNRAATRALPPVTPTPSSASTGFARLP